VRRAAALLAGALLLSGCAAPRSPVARTAAADTLTAWLDAARAEVQAVHDELIEARRRRDLEAALAARAEDFTAVRADGTRLGRADFASALRDFDAHLVELRSGTSAFIERLEDWSPRRPWEADGEALLVLRVRQRLECTYRAEEAGPPQEAAWETVVRETWRRTPGGWLQVQVEELAE